MTIHGPSLPAPARALRHLAGAGLAVLSILGHPTETRAEWIPNGAQVVPWDGIHPSLLGDGNGGAFLAWDYQGRIRLERIGSDGSVPPGLPGGGANLYTSPHDQRYPLLIPDGSGGMYVVWTDERWIAPQCPGHCGSGLPLEIYIVRLLADFSVAPGWPAGGMSVGAPLLPYFIPPQACTDGAGGLIVAWSEPSSPDAGNIRARRFGPDGSSVWGDSPTAVCSNTNGQFDPRLAPDGTGGAIIVWRDDRHVLPGYALFAQRISGAGVAQWNAQGVPVSTTQGVDAGPARMIAGADGSAFVSWVEAGGGAYVGRITASGGVDWAFELGTTEAISDVRIAEDGAGGTFVAWSDNDLHLLRLSPDGSPPLAWIGSEIVCDAPGLQADPRVTSDDAGGAYLLWRDERSGGAEVFATHIDASGSPASGWPVNGRVVCSAPGTRTIQALARDGVGGAIALWDDQRDIPTEVLYAQRFVPSGLLEAPAPGKATFALLAPRPNPVRGALVATFELPDASAARLELLDIAGRRVEAREVGSLGAGRHTITFQPGSVAPGVYVLRLARADGMRTMRVAILPGSR